MTEAARKPRGKMMRLDEGVMTPAQLDRLLAPDVRIEMFVSSRLGPDVSCETDHERDLELKTVAAAIADLEDRQ